MQKTAPSPFSKGFALSELTLGVVFLFVLVALVINFADLRNVTAVVYDYQLYYKAKAVSDELIQFNLSGEYPSCSEMLGKAPFCTGIVFGGVRSCNCPFFELKGLETGIFPYPGFKYVKTPGGFCLSAVANSPKKGKFFRINYPIEKDIIRANEGC